MSLSLEADHSLSERPVDGSECDEGDTRAAALTPNNVDHEDPLALLMRDHPGKLPSKVLGWDEPATAEHVICLSPRARVPLER